MFLFMNIFMKIYGFKHAKARKNGNSCCKTKSLVSNPSHETTTRIKLKLHLAPKGDRKQLVVVKCAVIRFPSCTGSTVEKVLRLPKQ